ncbi:Cytochrome P450 71A9 [Platanthera guangdongensis]|uniref:Cytochrome P450 71A9 n=1 Tax=Platanthera guangdongensis TaxID=2320717 RepID=A0ABR2M9T9_9ASPA
MLNELVNNVLCRVVLESPLGDQRRKLVSNLVQRNSTINTILFMEDFCPRLGWLDRIFGSENRIKSHFGAWDVLLDEFIEDHLTNKSTNYPSADRTDFIQVLLQLQKDPNMEFALSKDHIKAALIFATGIGLPPKDQSRHYLDHNSEREPTCPLRHYPGHNIVPAQRRSCLSQTPE